jgi:predicted Zn-dependent protease
MDVRRVPRGRAGWRRLGDRPSGASGRRRRGSGGRGRAGTGRLGGQDAEDAFGEAFWLELRQEVPFDRSGEAWALVQRAAARVQARFSPRRRFLVEVPWVGTVPAFTVAGRRVYVSRHFVDRFPHEAGIAFAIAHEVAHHELGHVYRWTTWVRRARCILPDEGGLTAGVLAGALEAYLSRPDWELEADRVALRSCTRAGYGAEECIRVLEALETLALERRDIDGVFGPEGDDGRPISGLERWLWRRERRYPSLRFRRAVLTGEEPVN